LNFDSLKLLPEELVINFPDSSSTIVEATRNLPKSGYEFRDDEDPPGTPPFWVIPGASNSDMSYVWAGTDGEYQVLINVMNGRLWGYITSNSKRYGIQMKSNGEYKITDFNISAFAPNDPPYTPKAIQSYDTNTKSQVEVRNLKIHSDLQNGINRSSNSVLDVLVFWDEDARLLNCSNPCSPTDTSGIDALIDTSIEHTNQALINSLTSTRVTKFATAELVGFVWQGDDFDSREDFRTNQDVIDARNQVGADLVIYVLGVDSNTFENCGITHVQSHPTCDATPVPGCSDGSDFESFAFAMVAQDCAIWNDTFTHEVGHMLGGNHVALEDPDPDAQLSVGWVNAVSNNGYPEAFATLEPGQFATIMSSAGSPSRSLYFSNPSVTVGGVVTGDSLTRDNAKIIDDLSPFMTTFRTRPELIFINGFD